MTHLSVVLKGNVISDPLTYILTLSDQQSCSGMFLTIATNI